MTQVISRRIFLATSAAAATGLMVTRPASARVPALELNQVVRVAIHPAVGIARVGNSEDAFYFAPEVPGSTPHGAVKDARGAMAKQAARFRLYGYDRDGRVVGEITANDAKIEWTVRVGNAKAAWYGADEPLDLPNSEPMPLRNPEVTNRLSLAILSDAKTVKGMSSGPHALSGGDFGGQPVDLGEILTDQSGRLVVLAGSGEAVSLPGAPALSGFADNDGWSDTTADGPVSATLRIGDRTFTADPAWVVCASPNFGAGMSAGLTTLYDAAFAGLVLAGRRSQPRTNFHRDIAPIFERMTDMQWVNAGYLTTNGFGSLRDWTTVAWQKRLTDRSAANAPLRHAILGMFRDPYYGSVQPSFEPQEYGDRVQLPPNREEPRQWLAITPVQYAHLRAWAEGRFTVEQAKRPRSLADLPSVDQPAALDRAALDGCLGGAFHPGVEFPWIARVAWLWTDDLRFAATTNVPNLGPFGETLTPAVATSPDGPLSVLGPGDIVKWMGVPWQADSASCRFGYQKTVSTVLPSFWSARIPNSVLTTEDYRVVMDTTKTLDERRKAFRRRSQWERYIATPDRLTVLSLMVNEWSRLGVVRDRPGPGDKHFPARMKVEARLGFRGLPPDSPAWANRNQLTRFPLMVANSAGQGLLQVTQDAVSTVVTVPGRLGDAQGVAHDAMGNLYVALTDKGEILRVSVAGEVFRVAWGLSAPVAVACDGWGNIYASGIGDGGWVKVIRSDTSLDHLLGPQGDGWLPMALAIAPDGALLIADDESGSIMRYDPLLQDVLDANWITGLTGPRGMAWDSAGKMYVIENESNSVRMFDQDGAEQDFSLTGSGLTAPYGIAFDGESSLFVSSSVGSTGRIDMIELSNASGVVSVFLDGLPRVTGVAFQGSLTPVPLV